VEPVVGTPGDVEVAAGCSASRIVLAAAAIVVWTTRGSAVEAAPVVGSPLGAVVASAGG
jgi:hypothetical protein